MLDALLRDMDANTILQATLASSHKLQELLFKAILPKWRDEEYKGSNFDKYTTK